MCGNVSEKFNTSKNYRLNASEKVIITLTSQALASLYVVRQYIASSIGKWPLEGMWTTQKQTMLILHKLSELRTMIMTALKLPPQSEESFGVVQICS
jgi:hypothetical protein